MWVKNERGSYDWKPEIYAVESKTCLNCGKEFKRNTQNTTSWRARKYCSLKCANQRKMYRSYDY